MDFNYTEHAEMLFEIEHLVFDCLMTAEVLSTASCHFDGAEYVNLISGALGLMSTALERVHTKISEQEYPFRAAHGLPRGKSGIAVLHNNAGDETEERA